MIKAGFILVLLPATILAQDRPRVEVFGGYSYLHIDTQGVTGTSLDARCNRISSGTCPPGTFHVHPDANGWDASADVTIHRSFGASKAAVRSFARTLTAELADRGIRINVVSPGPVPTTILERTGMSQEAIDETLRGLVSQVPMKRAGRPEEVADAVLFLSGPESSYITGVDLNVDGGMGQV
jgi:NAD(P)-dependent dehydrogenase (short-subunit alcohol dehydrogenase family)